jgi:ribosomal protein S6
MTELKDRLAKLAKLVAELDRQVRIGEEIIRRMSS